ncbi:Fic family protein [Candidatus Saccharibacteria bacterium]|nr:MAG: Fic family protein [Candidatus Saccharibacteria bacterium]
MKTTQILKALLQQSGLTQVELAERLGVSHPTFSAWLHGKSTPRKDAAERVQAAAFELLGIGTVSASLVDETVRAASHAKLHLEDILQEQRTLDTLCVLMTYNTNSIEGSTMTLADNKKVLLSQKTLRNRSAREQLEARNHQAALLWLLQQVADGGMTACYGEHVARELHVRLMNGLLSDAGQYRGHGVRIMGSHTPVANYQKVPEKMAALFRHEPPTDFESLAKFHAQFEKIHPFSDGNGRVGRLLLAGLLLSAGITPVIIRRESRSAYYRYLEIAQLEENYQPLTYLLARETLEAYKSLAKTKVPESPAI